MRDLVEIVFILDRSGSMSGLEDDTIGGFNNLIEKQKKLEGDALLTTVLFDNHYEILHDRLDINQINKISNKEYFVRGSTALLDAIGRSINNIIQVHKKLSINQKPNKVMFLITTDGMENSSREYSYRKIKEMIKHQKTYYDWEFIFLGANIDAQDVGGKFGIEKDYTVNYHADKQGIDLNYKVLDIVVSNIRLNKKIDKSWKADIEEDYISRK